MHGKLQKVLIMAGGTGGHVFPGLAVAEELRRNNITVDWLGTHRGLESKLIPAAGFPIHYISIAGLRGKDFISLLLAPFRLLIAITQALWIIQRLKPDVVLGMGGFASGPGGFASWLLRYPLVVHEQNAKPGLTNKLLARVAKKILEGFPDTFVTRKNTVTTGNPVRTEIALLATPDNRFKDRVKPLRLLVIGGSLGAAAINNVVPRALAKIPIAERPEVYHQSGEKLFADAVQAYKAAEVTANIKPFITAMDEAYAWADIVLCRAGALTIAELCAAGLGSILVPYPHAADDHQTANANYLVKHDAALLVQQTALTEQVLVDIIKQLSASPDKRYAMAQAAYDLRKVDATSKVLEICGEICR